MGKKIGQPRITDTVTFFEITINKDPKNQIVQDTINCINDPSKLLMSYWVYILREICYELKFYDNYDLILGGSLWVSKEILYFEGYSIYPFM